MAAGNRAFRKPESYVAERISRDLIRPFLEDRGFVEIEDIRRKVGLGESQEVVAKSPNGESMRMHVKLCWRRDGRNAREGKYSAAQLRADTVDGDWLLTLQYIVERNAEQSITHFLILQREGSSVVYAALVPLNQLSAIWEMQRDVSAELIRQRLMGRIKKNHAMNGKSPTIWLQDDRTPAAHAVADVLWNWPRVQDVVNMPVVVRRESLNDDTFDDCPGLDFATLGSDGAERRRVLRSEVRRDRQIREAVLDRAGDKCERPGCDSRQSYRSFFDVHHILGVEKSDRYWNCVALCPNCHREAHASPEADAINAALLSFANAFAPQ